MPIASHELYRIVASFVGTLALARHASVREKYPTRTNPTAPTRRESRPASASPCYFALTVVVTDSSRRLIARVVTTGARRDDAEPDARGACPPSSSARHDAARRALREYLASSHDQRPTEWIDVANSSQALTAAHIAVLVGRATAQHAPLDGIELIHLPDADVRDPGDSPLPALVFDDSTRARCARRNAAVDSRSAPARWVC